MNLLTALHEAMVGRWLADEDILEALGGPYVFSRDWPPPDPDNPADPLAKPPPPYAYITIGDKSEGEVGVLGHEGFSNTLTAHVWTVGYYDDGPAETIYRLMVEALKQPLVLAGFGGIALRREFAAVVADPDLEIRHVNARWRASTIALEAA